MGGGVDGGGSGDGTQRNSFITAAVAVSGARSTISEPTSPRISINGPVGWAPPSLSSERASPHPALRLAAAAAIRRLSVRKSASEAEAAASSTTTTAGLRPAAANSNVSDVMLDRCEHPNF